LTTDSVRCPSCGKPTPDENLRCIFCGELLATHSGLIGRLRYGRLSRWVLALFVVLLVWLFIRQSF